MVALQPERMTMMMTWNTFRVLSDDELGKALSLA